MGAVAGIVQLDGRPVDREEVRRMSRALRSLGPDGEGEWVDGSAGFAWRLMRFTPEDTFERQPLVHAESGTVLVADARVDYREELAPQLGIEPTELSRTPDSEFLLRAWLKWGRDLVDRVIGSFAVVVWDARRRELFAACTLGEAPPLYFHQDERSLRFASMPRGLFAGSGLNRELNESWLADFLVLNRRDRRQTPWRGVQLLPGGHALAASDRGVRLLRFWDPHELPEVRLPSDQAYLERFRDLFDDAVRVRLRGDRVPAILLSGGLDSGLIAASAAVSSHDRGQPVRSFTQIPAESFRPDPSARHIQDESPYVRDLAACHPNLETRFVRSGGASFLEVADACFAHTEAPIRNPSNLPWILDCIRHAGSDGRTVLLDGGEGNLIFSWSGVDPVQQFLKKGQLVAAWRELLARSEGRLRVAARRLAAAALEFLPGPAFAWYRRVRVREAGTTGRPFLDYSPIHPAFARELDVVGRCARIGFPLDLRPEPDKRMVRGRVLWARDGFFDGMSRSRYGVDARSPAVDRRLAEWCLGLPEEQYRRDGQSRRLARVSFPDRLPESILANPRRGEQAADWLGHLGSRLPLVDEVLSAMRGSPQCRRSLDLDRLDRLRREWPRPGAMSAREIWMSWGFCFQRGLFLGQFLLWWEKGAPTVEG